MGLGFAAKAPVNLGIVVEHGIAQRDMDKGTFVWPAGFQEQNFAPRFAETTRDNTAGRPCADHDIIKLSVRLRHIPPQL